MPCAVMTAPKEKLMGGGWRLAARARGGGGNAETVAAIILQHRRHGVLPLHAATDCEPCRLCLPEVAISPFSKSMRWYSATGWCGMSKGEFYSLLWCQYT